MYGWNSFGVTQTVQEQGVTHNRGNYFPSPARLVITAALESLCHRPEGWIHVPCFGVVTDLK